MTPTDQRLREIALPSATLLVCPWCKDDDFDAVGLKLHIVNGHCDAFNSLSACLPATRQAKSDFRRGDLKETNKPQSERRRPQ